MSSHDECPHHSATGVDTTPLDDPSKVWRCDACGWLYRRETYQHTAWSVVFNRNVTLEVSRMVAADTPTTDTRTEES